jgi:hypothetical protein
MENYKYDINEVVYLVNDYSIIKVKVQKIVLIKSSFKLIHEYVVTPLIGDAQTRSKEKTVNEAYLVRTFEEAQQSAIQNLENSYQRIKGKLLAITEDMYDEPVESEEDANS